MLEDDAMLHSEQSEFDMIKDLTGNVYLTGSDTTVSAIHSYFLAMLIWPDIQTKAQAEVDHVIGKDRLPVFEDAPNMPYVQAVINECLRWIPVFPLCKSPQLYYIIRLAKLANITSSCPACHKPVWRVSGLPHSEGNHNIWRCLVFVISRTHPPCN
jgi:hypothetical protein